MASKVDLECYTKVQELLINADPATIKQIKKLLDTKIDVEDEPTQQDEDLTPSSNVKDAYCNAYETDELGLEINPKLTFNDVHKALKSGKDFYDFIGVGDSLVRERIFEMMSDIFNKDYDYFYNLWLGKPDSKTKKLVKAVKKNLTKK